MSHLEIPRLRKLYTNIEKPDVLKRLKIARATFLRDDVELLGAPLHENAYVFRFAVYIDRLFPEWDVDVQYNRDGKDKKRQPNDPSGALRIPDIVVHHRETEGENLIVFEAKKSANATDPTYDPLKLEKWQRFYHYLYAVKLDFMHEPFHRPDVEYVLTDKDGVLTYSSEPDPDAYIEPVQVLPLVNRPILAPGVM